MTTMSDVARNFLIVKRGLLKGYQRSVETTEKNIAKAKDSGAVGKLHELEGQRAWSLKQISDLTFETDAVDYLLQRLENKALRIDEEDAADIRAEMKRYTGGIEGEFARLPPF